VRIAWFSLVAPALVLNYFGQGALLMAEPAARANPFYLLLPGWALYPMVALATAATVIASQAVITGAFSITRQAVQLGFLPRMTIVHTSAREIGQIYIPGVNWLLCAVVIGAVIGFGSSSRLAGAYGVAVTGTMLVDTLLTFFVIRYAWNYPLWLCLAATGFFLVIDLGFFSATLLKVADGGWFPLVIGAAVFLLMSTWRRGRERLLAQLQESSVPLEPFLKSLFAEPPHALLHSLKHYRALHERVVFLTVEFRDVPWVPFEERVVLERLGHQCWRVRVRYGFMNPPDLLRALEVCGALGLEFNLMETSFFLSREKIVPAERGAFSMARWREHLFSAMARNASNVSDYFNIPANCVVELGTRVEI
jgi:KUP system potassium uptake protein